MRPLLVVVALATSGAVTSIAHAQDAAPAPQAPPSEAPPAAAPPPVAAPPPGAVEAPPPAEEEREANNAIYFELFGPGLLYSLNYDRTFGDFAARIGVGYISLTASAGSSRSGTLETAKAYFLAVPLTVSYLGIGSKKHMFELGAGVTIYSVGAGFSALGAESSSSGSALWAAPTAIIGYRMQPPKGGFFFRAGFSPLFILGTDGSAFFPWPHVGLGGVF